MNFTKKTKQVLFHILATQTLFVPVAYIQSVSIDLLTINKAIGYTIKA